MTPAEMLAEFRATFDLAASRELWLRLLREEAQELIDAIDAGDFTEAVHEAGDVTYVAYGLAGESAFDFDAVVAEIHRANMSKVGPDGEIERREDGKVMKGPFYRPPDVARVLGE